MDFCRTLANGTDALELGTAECLSLFLSAIFYFASLTIFGDAVDARLSFYTSTALSIFTYISIFKLRNGRE
jgi:hypothetical protein